MFDEKLALRIQKILEGFDATERKMFGGIAFLDRGHMFCGVAGDDLMVRVGPERYESALAESHARPMTFTGRPMRGLVYVSAEGTRSEAALRKWLERGLQFTATLAAKSGHRSARARRS